MYYVMSDLHGEYDKYLKMLDLIQFSEQDSLFILGDVVDRGAKPVSILRDMMLRPNVFPLMGNHDYMALYLLEKLCVEITEQSLKNTLSEEDVQDVLFWMEEGGKYTIAEFVKLSIPERQEVIEYLSEFSLYEALDVGDKTFILVHAGLGNFRKDKKLSQYTPEELLLTRADPDQKLFDDDDVYIITGHTPTPLISGKPEIYHSNHNICIDCGAVFEGGKLACLCLDTMQEFYI